MAAVLVFMAYHQKCLSTFHGRPSHTCGAWTSFSLWRQRRISFKSLKYQPLATMPCCVGSTPVSIEVWAVVVTAGRAGDSGWLNPSFERRVRCGVSAPKCRGVSPTQFKSTSGCMEGDGWGKTGFRLAGWI
jgi:hypothetical protein